MTKEIHLRLRQQILHSKYSVIATTISESFMSNDSVIIVDMKHYEQDSVVSTTECLRLWKFDHCFITGSRHDYVLRNYANNLIMLHSSHRNGYYTLALSPWTLLNLKAHLEPKFIEMVMDLPNEYNENTQQKFFDFFFTFGIGYYKQITMGMR
jgi:hypothetical protein